MEFDIDVLRNDLDKLALLNKKDREELLLLSVVRKDNKVIKRLIRLGINVDTMNENKDTALVLACDKDNVEAIKLLVENGANVNYTGSSLGTPLYLACQNGNKYIVMYLVSRGACINDVSNYNKETPLIRACRSLNKDIVKFLIQKGADVNIANLHGVTPISMLCKYAGGGCEGAFSIAKLLVRNGAKLNIIEQDGVTTPLLIASKYRNSKLVALLVENGAVIKPSYNKMDKQFIESIIADMYPSLEQRQEIKKELEVRDIEGFGACLYDYLEIKELNQENYNGVYKKRKYIDSLIDGEEFREVIREIKELRQLISMSKNDRYLIGRIGELNKKLELDMEIFKLVNNMRSKLKRLEKEKCENIGLNRINRSKLGEIRKSVL